MTKRQTQNLTVIDDRIRRHKNAIWLLQGMKRKASVAVSAERIITWACVAAGIDRRKVMSNRRWNSVTTVRRIIVKQLHDYGYRTAYIASVMGRDESTILTSLRDHAAYSLNEEYRALYERCDHFVYSSSVAWHRQLIEYEMRPTKGTIVHPAPASALVAAAQ